jgi:hypothetical protein
MANTGIRPISRKLMASFTRNGMSWDSACRWVTGFKRRKKFCKKRANCFTSVKKFDRAGPQGRAFGRCGKRHEGCLLLESQA